MKTKSIQMTATLRVSIGHEDLDLVWDCAEDHYDSRVRGMTQPRSSAHSSSQAGLLVGIRNQLGERESAEVNLAFDDLDTMGKALEAAAYALPHERAVEALKLGAEIHKMLRLINEQNSSREYVDEGAYPPAEEAFNTLRAFGSKYFDGVDAKEFVRRQRGR